MALEIQLSSYEPAHGASTVGVLRQAVEAMLSAYSAAAASPRTVKAYRGCAELLLHAVSDGVAIPPDKLGARHLTCPALRSAFAQLAETHSAGTVRLCWTVANRICAILQRDGRIPDSPMRLIPRPIPAQQIPAALTDDAVVALLRAAGTPAPRDASRWPQRDLALIALMLTTGVTTDQTLTLRTTDLEDRPERGSHLRMSARSGHGWRSRPVPLLVAEAVHRYLHARARKLRADVARGQPAMFVYVDGRAMGPSGIRYAIARAFQHADIEDQRPAHAMARALCTTYKDRYLIPRATLPEAIDGALIGLARLA